MKTQILKSIAEIQPTFEHYFEGANSSTSSHSVEFTNDSFTYNLTIKETVVLDEFKEDYNTTYVWVHNFETFDLFGNVTDLDITDSEILKALNL